MRTYSVTLYEKERNRTVTYTAEYLHMKNGFLHVYHRILGNVHVRLQQHVELTITQDREEEE